MHSTARNGQGFGLDNGQIIQSLDRITDGDHELLYNLIPAEPLESPAILKILTSLSKLPSALQATMIQQLAILISLEAVSTEGIDILENLYIVLDKRLEYGRTRNATAELLSVIAKKQCVTFSRVISLQNLIRRIGTPSDSLLRLHERYRSFYPNLIPTYPHYRELSDPFTSETDIKYANAVKAALQLNPSVIVSNEDGGTAESLGNKTNLKVIPNTIAILQETGLIPKYLDNGIMHFLRQWDGEELKQEVWLLLPRLPPSSMLEALKLLVRLALTSPVDWITRLIRAMEACLVVLQVADDEERALQVTALAGPILRSSMVANPTSLILRDASLSFYERFYSFSHSAPPPLPPSELIYFSLLAPEAASSVRICGIITLLRSAYSGSDQPEADAENVAKLNNFIVQIIDILWNRRMRDEGALGLTPETLAQVKREASEMGLNAADILSLTFNPAFAGFAVACLQSFMAPNVTIPPGPIMPSTLKAIAAAGGPEISWSQYRIYLLEYLEERGGEDMHTFFFTSLQSLIKRKISM